MANAKHSAQTVADGIHIIHAFEYANAAARTGATGLLPADVGKVARQLDDGTFWVLNDDSPLTWTEITAGGGGVPAHASTHENGGADAIKLDDLATPDDNTDLDASTARHGLLPKLGGGSTNFLRADGSWAAPVAVFGADYASEESLGESSTTSATYQTKVSMVTPALTGTYRVGWSARVWQSGIADRVQSRLRNVTDDVVLGGPFDAEPEDANDRWSVGGFAEVVFTGASKTFAIEWREQDGSTAYIDGARIEFWRVS